MGETFFLCGLGEALVEVAPLFALACGGFGEVGLGVADDAGGIAGGDFYGAAFKEGEECACVGKFLVGSFKDARTL